MGWNYDWTDIANNSRDQIRLEIGDTDPGNPQLQDEEIAYALATERNMWAAAARCCEMIARVRLGKADVRLGRNLQIQYSRTAEQYLNMAKDLRRKAMGTVVPYVGGTLITEKQNIEENNDLVSPAFTRTMQENPWAGGYTPDSTGTTRDSDDNESF